MKKWLLLLITLAAALPGAQAQGGRGFWHQEWCVEKGDSVPLVHILPVYVFSRPVDLRRYRKLVDAVKKVYPIARIAKAKMAAMEEELCRLPTKKAQKAYIRQVYNQIKEEYTPVLKHMTRTQGKVLLKLIDRETEYTAYEVLKEFRGGFVAGFWQGVSHLRTEPQVGIRQAERRPDDRTDRNLLRSRTAAVSDRLGQPGCDGWATGLRRLGNRIAATRQSGQKLNDRPTPTPI